MVRCRACGLGHTEPVPPDLERYYGERYYGGRHGATAAYCAWRRVQILERSRKGQRGKLLDVGCGEGTFLTAAGARGWEGTGVEIGRARALAQANGARVLATLDEAAGAGPFAAITFWHSLEHMPDPRRALTTARQLLEPGGTLIVAVPDADGWQARAFGATWVHLDVPRHLFHFDPRSLGAILEASGFALEATHHQELEYDLFGWIQSASNVVLKVPNVLYGRIAGQKAPVSRSQELLAILMGGALLPAALAATAAGSLARRGGTLIAVGRTA